MSFIVAWFVKKFGIATVLSIVNGLYIAFVVTYFIFIINALHTITTVIQQLFTYISSSSVGGSGVGGGLSAMNGYLSAIGFWSAVETIIPLFISAIVFLLTRILYKSFHSAYKNIVASATRAANLYI